MWQIHETRTFGDEVFLQQHFVLALVGICLLLQLLAILSQFL